ncbi:MAG: hypothetical protein ACRENE_19740, partial [Polyangiaceae bacterium]
TRVSSCPCPVAAQAFGLCSNAAFGCAREDSGATPDAPGSGWLGMTLATIDGTQQFSTATQHANLFPLDVNRDRRGMVPTTHADLSQANASETPFDFGWAYWDDLGSMLGSLDTSGATVTVFDGLVWTWVRNQEPILSLFTTDFVSMANGGAVGTSDDFLLRQSVTPIVVTESVQAKNAFNCVPTNETVGFRAPFAIGGCPGCIGAAMTIVTNVGDPAERVSIINPGIQVREASSLYSTPLLGEMLDTRNTFVSASDLLWASGTRLGVVVNTASHAIVDIADSFEGGFIGEISTPLDPPLFDKTPPAIAVSAHRQEVAFFGEHDAQGNVLNNVRTYDFDLGKTITWPILSHVTISHAVAATYRAQDDAYWVLDEVDAAQPQMRLLRVARGVTVRVVAQWVRAARFDTFFLTTASDGSLVITSSTKDKHAVAVLAITGSTPSLTALYFNHDPIAVSAYKSLDDIDLATRSSDGSIVPSKVIARTSHAKDLDDDVVGPAKLTLHDTSRVF